MKIKIEKYFTLILLYYGIFLSCNGNQIDLDQDIDIIEVVTSDPNDNTFFYNFLTNEERDDIWQLSYSAQIAEQSLILPSVDLSDKILLYVEETIAFDDIVSAPSSTLFFQGKKQLSYKGDYEVLVYDYGTKSIEVSKNSFIIYDTSSERAFKLKFLSYDDWILRFKYSEL